MMACIHSDVPCCLQEAHRLELDERELGMELVPLHEGNRQQGPDPPGPASSEYVSEDLPKRRTRLLNKADGKNRESENPEEISLLSGRNPTVVLEHRGERFETENRQRGEGGGTSVCEYGRNDRTPKGCPTGSCVNGRPPKLADENMAPHMILSPEPFSVRQW